MSIGHPRRSVPYYDALPDSPAHHVARRSASVLASHPLGQPSGSASRATSASTRSALVCFPVPPDTPRPICRCPELAAACFGSETLFNAPLPLRANLTQPLPLRISPRVSNPAPALHTHRLAPLCRGYSRSGTAPTPDLSALSAVVRLYGVPRSVSALPARRVMSRRTAYGPPVIASLSTATPFRFAFIRTPLGALQMAPLVKAGARALRRFAPAQLLPNTRFHWRGHPVHPSTFTNPPRSPRHS